MKPLLLFGLALAAFGGELPRSWQGIPGVEVTLHEAGGSIWLTVTQGDFSPSREERILFGKLE